MDWFFSLPNWAVPWVVVAAFAVIGLSQYLIEKHYGHEALSKAQAFFWACVFFLIANLADQPLGVVVGGVGSVLILLLAQAWRELARSEARLKQLRERLTQLEKGSGQ